MRAMAMETRIRPSLETVRYTRVRIAVIKGPDLGLTIERAGTTIKIGTSEDSDLQLQDDTVSREHCEIALDERGFRIVDRGSTNGVRVQGLRVYDIASAAPLELALGESVLAVTPLAEVEPRERVNTAHFDELLGHSPRMRELFAILARVAATDLSVLIEGETGTGKELVARSIHRSSPRADKPFRVFDCSVASNNLIESDLFGHEKGAFTSADKARTGALEEADGGTLFLDELGELPLEMQQKLLRCLQEGEFRRLGGRKVLKTDVRLIAATNRNLHAEVAAGRFRQDLYYRVEGITVHLPALRERIEDLPLLVDHFLSQSGFAPGSAQLPPNALEMFRAHRWPGNVRELRNVVRRMVLLPDMPFRVDPSQAQPVTGSRGSQLEQRVVQPLAACWTADPANLPADWLALENARREVQEAFELDYLALLKHMSGGVKARAAVWARTSRQAIQKLVRKHDLDWSDSDDGAQNE
jgi:transcriptional regulator with GAF, ATPase, and Fis domain